MEKSIKNFFYPHELKLVYICLLIFCPILLNGQKDKKGIQKGIVTDSVICAGYTLQSYSLFLPPEYDEKRKWLLILIFDPGGRGRTGIKNFIQAGNKYGYLLARAEALDGQISRADASLERSIKYGLSNKAIVINDPAFAKILNDRRFKKLTEKLK